ncbi:unnamed protein product, partial [marine sediment metagenome]
MLPSEDLLIIANLVREEWKDKEEEIVLKLSDLLIDLESGKLQAEHSQKERRNNG